MLKEFYGSSSNLLFSANKVYTNNDLVKNKHYLYLWV